MPKAIENKLKKSANKKHLTGERKDAYVYGTMNNLGLMHGNKPTAKGKASDKRHSRLGKNKY